MAVLRDARAAIHLALTAVMAWLALVLALPDDTFRLSPAYALMAAMGREDAWAVAFWAVACIGAAGLSTPSRGLRLASVLTLATMHGVVALCFGVSSPATTGSGTYAVLAGLGYYLAWRRTHEGL